MKTKQTLINALSNLIESTDLEQITVSQLCKEAGINRTTFYKYYTVPSDILQEYTENILKNVIYSDEQPYKTPYEYMLNICRIVYENRQMMRAYFHARGNLVQIFYSTLINHSSNLDYMADPVNVFISGGIGSTLMAWVHRDFAEPPETVAKRMADCMARLIAKPEEGGAI